MQRVQSQSLGTTNAQHPTPVPKVVPGVTGKPRVVPMPAGTARPVRPMSTAKYAWTQVQPAPQSITELLQNVALPEQLDAEQLNRPLRDLLADMPVAQYLAQGQGQSVSDLVAGGTTGGSASNAAVVPMATGSAPNVPSTPPAAPVAPVQVAARPATRAAAPQRYTPQYQELPSAPELAASPAVPIRDLLADKQYSQDASKFALLGPLAALLTGGSVSKAASYMPINLSAALAGAQQGNDHRFANDVNAHRANAAAVENANDQALAQYGRQVGAINSHNTIEGRREQQSARLEALVNKANADLRRDGETFLKNLVDLDPDSQRRTVAAAQASGELDRLGSVLDLPTDAAGNFVPIVKAAPVGTLTTEQKIEQDNKQRETENLRGELRTQYDLLKNPRITKAGAEEAGKRIAQIQKKLGYGTGADVVSIGLDQFTPEQRAQIKLAQDRLALQKQNAASLQSYRAQTVEQRRQKAQVAAAKSTKAAGGDPTKAFNQNQRRISSIERELQGTNAASVTPERRAALEYERATLSDQQAFLSGKVPALTTGTRTRGGLPGGRPATVQRKTPQVGGRVTAALASKATTAAPARPETRSVTVDGGTFTVRRRSK